MKYITILTVLSFAFLLQAGNPASAPIIIPTTASAPTVSKWEIGPDNKPVLNKYTLIPNPVFIHFSKYKAGTSTKIKRHTTRMTSIGSISEEEIETRTIISSDKDMVIQELKTVTTNLNSNNKPITNTYSSHYPAYIIPPKPIGTMPIFPKKISQNIIDKGEEDVTVSNNTYHCNWTIQETIYERANHVIVVVKVKDWVPPIDVPMFGSLKCETTNTIDDKIIYHSKFEVIERIIPK